MASKWISEGFPRLSLVEPVWFGIGYPFLDLLSGWLDGLPALDIEWRQRWRATELNDALPKAVETEEELDLLGAIDGTC